MKFASEDNESIADDDDDDENADEEEEDGEDEDEDDQEEEDEESDMDDNADEVRLSSAEKHCLNRSIHSRILTLESSVRVSPLAMTHSWRLSLCRHVMEEAHVQEILH